MPLYIVDQVKRVFHTDIKVLDKERMNTLPPMHIIKDTLK